MSKGQLPRRPEYFPKMKYRYRARRRHEQALLEHCVEVIMNEWVRYWDNDWNLPDVDWPMIEEPRSE